MLTAICLFLSVAYAQQFKPRKEANGEYLTLNDLGHANHHGILHDYFNPSINNNHYSCSNNVNNEEDGSTAAPPLIYVTDFGADPTGSTDSSIAFQKAINVSLSYGYGGNLSWSMHDCGGATIHLGGGDYLLSSPLIIPQYYGNLIIMDGTIRACSDFQPKESYLLIIGDNKNGTHKCHNQGSGDDSNTCNQNIAIENMMFDCKLNCYGAINIIDTEGVVIGPQILILGFYGAGITVTGGHGTYISSAWLGEYLYSNPNKWNSSATGIELFGDDSSVTNTVIWSAHIGINNNGHTNLLNGVHCFNGGTHHGGIGILIQNNIHSRLVNCYLDYNDLVIMSEIDGVIIEDTYFLGGGTIQIRTTNNTNNHIKGLIVTNNQWNGGNNNDNNNIIEIDESSGYTIKEVRNVVISNNYVLGGYVYVGVRISKSLSLKNSNQFKFDFNDELAFKNVPIQWMSYTIQMDDDNNNQFIQHYAQKPVGTTVIIQTSQNVSATVYLTVDQSAENYSY